MMRRKRVALKGQVSFFELHKVEHKRGELLRHIYEYYLTEITAAGVGEFWAGFAPEGVGRQWAVYVKDECGRPRVLSCSKDYLPY